MSRSLRGRIEKMAGWFAEPGDCTGHFTAILSADDGVERHADGRVYDPAKAPRCDRCGGQHVLILTEKVVGAGHDAGQA